MKLNQMVTVAVALAVSAGLLLGCGPDRAQWMAQAKTEQAKDATESFGDVNNVRQQARTASGALAGVSGLVPSLSPQIALLTGGLDDIANSKTDEQFSDAVFGMCAPSRAKAADTVGSVLLLAMAKAKQDPRSAEPKSARAIAYFSGLGTTLVNIPPKCDRAATALAQESTQEQEAEAQHRTNVNRALLVAGAIFAGAVAVDSAYQIRQGLASQPAPVQNNYYYAR